MAAPARSQKEYLQRYLCGRAGSKRRRRRPGGGVGVGGGGGGGLRVVDDDIDLKNMRLLGDDEIDLYSLAEDAPQIAGIIDERPDELRRLEEFSSKKWKILAKENGHDDIKLSLVGERPVCRPAVPGDEPNPSKDKGRDSDESPPRHRRTVDDSGDVSRYASRRESSQPKRTSVGVGQRSRRSPADDALGRRPCRDDDSDGSPPKLQSQDRDSDESPPRLRRKGTDVSPSRPSKARRGDDSDESPLRRSREAPLGKTKVTSHGETKKVETNEDSDESPPRKGKRGESDTTSRSAGRQEIVPRTGRASPEARRLRVDSSEPDLSPRRSRRGNADTPRGKRRDGRWDSPSRMHDKHRNASPSRRGRDAAGSGSGKDRDRKGDSERLQRTMDGRRAGLQDAKELRRELADLQRREIEMFDKMDPSVSGKDAAPVVRDRRTGKRRDLEQEAKEQKEKEQKEAEHRTKYSRWGKGLKQVNDQAQRLKDDLYEMTKPLARYADDADLDRHLREQEREGDPMLEYIRSKATDSTKKAKPRYEGSFLPNRFRILPGHRWDGVDRSNGYERQWFEALNSKEAALEEAYRWSTADM